MTIEENRARYFEEMARSGYKYKYYVDGLWILLNETQWNEIEKTRKSKET